MQSMFGVILLPVLLTVCLSFQPAAGQDRQDTCGTCATCYQTLAEALIDTKKNRYSLIRGFFPPDSAPPVVVEVTYHFEDCNNCSSKLWYWTKGAFYIYQPLEVFVFRSLFFSHISILQGSADLQLPAECSHAPSEFFELLTQRLQAHAVSQTATPPVDSTYYAKAVSGDAKLDYEADKVYGFANNVHIDRLLNAYQYVPYTITFMIVTTAFILLCCLFCTCETPRKKISDEVYKVTKHTINQAVIVATVALCSCATFYIFVLDAISLHLEDNYDLPAYYKNNLGVYACTILFSFLSILFLVVGIVWFITLLFIWPCCQRMEKQYLALLIPIVSCVGSLVLSLSFHYQNILIAWSTDPFYAGRIAVYYGIIIFVYYRTFKTTYMIPLFCKKMLTPDTPNDAQISASDENVGVKSNGDNENGTEITPAGQLQSISLTVSPPPIVRSTGTPNAAQASAFDGNVGVKSKGNNKGNETAPHEVGLGILCVVIVGVLLSGFHALNAVFIYYIPINNFIEESVHGVQTIYNGAFILIGGLIAYNIGWLFFNTTKFSVEGALKKAMNELDNNPFGNVEKGWGDLSDEDRMKQVMKAVLIHGAKKVKD